MRKASVVTTVLATAVVVLSGCGSDDEGGTASSGGSSSAAESSSPGSSAAGEVALMTADTDLGTIVVDGKGMTVYIFDKDTQGSGKSVCSGDCLVAWPPVVAESDQPAVDGVTGDVGTITRDDGTKQVTLDGWPLYYWQNDKAPGDTTGQGVQGVWWVVTADGAKVTESAAPASLRGY